MEQYILLKKREIIINDLIEGKSAEIENIFPDKFSSKWLPIKRVHPKKEDFNMAKEKIIELSRNCILCYKKCGKNRLKENTDCGPPIRNSYLFDYGILKSEEFSPTYALYFSNCNLKCSVCNYRKYWVDVPYDKQIFLNIEEFSKEIEKKFKNREVFSVLFTGGNPDQSIYGIIELLERIPENLPVLYQTNGTMTKELYETVKGFLDIIILSKELSKEHNINEKIYEKEKILKLDKLFIFNYNKGMKRKEFDDWFAKNYKELFKSATKLNMYDAKNLLDGIYLLYADKKKYQKLNKNLHAMSFIKKAIHYYNQNEYRKRKRETERNTPLPEDDTIPNEELSPEQIAIKEEIREELRRKIEKLPEPYKQIIILVGIEGKSSKEAAKILGISPDNVRQIFSRAKGKIYEMYTGKKKVSRSGKNSRKQGKNSKKDGE